MEKNGYHHKNLREELIEAGVKLVEQEGAEALSLRRLAAECGVTHAAPYKHFKDKEDILQAVTSRIYTIFGEELQKNVEKFQDEPAQRRILELGKRYVEFALEHPEFLKLMFFYGNGKADPGKLQKAESPEEVGPADSLMIFRNVAGDYLASLQTPPEEYEYHLVSLWALVHGVAVMLQNRNWEPAEPVLDAVEKVLAAFHRKI